MKMSLEEATMKALLSELEDDEPKDDVEGIIDGVLVVTDPEITPEEYEEVIERADELIEDTPEGEVPFNEDYVGEYLLTCPICGSTFINKTVLNVGDSCPICTKIPEQGFILNGQVATQEDVELQNDIKSEEQQEENDDVNIGFEEVPEEEPISEEDVEETEEELLASEVQRTADNKLEEDKEILLTKDIDSEEEAQDIVNSKSVFKKGDKVKVKDWNGREYNVTKTTTSFSDNEKEVESKETYMKRPEQLNEVKDIKIKSEKNNLEKIRDIVDWLVTHNKNYTKEQYYKILDLQDLLDLQDSKEIKIESNKYIPVEEKLEAIYNNYKNQGMEKAYWTELIDIINNFDELNRWFDSLYPDEEDLDENWDKLEESANKDYTLTVADPDKIKELEKGSAFTWEGLDTTSMNLEHYVTYFKVNTPTIKLPINFFTWKGKVFNEMYGLTGDNAYPEDLDFVSIALDNWDAKAFSVLPMIKFQLGARWLDDIVNNNAVRQKKLNKV